MHRRKQSTQCMSRPLFTPITLNPSFTSRAPLTHRRQSSNTSNQDCPKLYQNRKWVIDRSPSYKQQQETTLSEALTELKRSYNLQVVDTGKATVRTKRMMKTTNKYGSQASNIHNDAERLREGIVRAELELKARMDIHQQAQMDRKVMEGMFERLKLDTAYLYLRQEELKKTLKAKGIDLRLQENALIVVENIESEEGTQLRRLRTEFVQQEHVREQQLHEGKYAITREKRAKILIEAETSIPLFQGTHARKVTMVQMLLRSIINRKIEKLNVESKALETNYKHILTMTNLNNMEELAQKYLSKEDHHQKLASEVKKLEEKLRQVEERNKQIVCEIKRLHLDQLSARTRKFHRIQLQSSRNETDHKIDLIETWTGDKAGKLGLQTKDKGPLGLVKQICLCLRNMVKDRELASEYFSKKFFHEGISVKKFLHPMPNGEEKRARAAELMEMKQNNEVEMEFLNRVRISVKKHVKSQTMM